MDRQPATLCEWLAASASRRPEAPAVTDGERTVTYGELLMQSRRIAYALRDRGVRPGTIVGLFCDRSPEAIAAMLGTWQLGAAFTPLDPRLPPARLAYMIDDAGVSVVVVGPDDAAGGPIQRMRKVVTDVATAPGAPTLEDGERASGDRGALAYLMYTSGSTGRPKGVMVEHNQLLRLFASGRQLFSPSASDVWTSFHSLSFDFSVWELWGALLFGGRVVVVPQRARVDMRRFGELIVREGVTVLNATPTVFGRLHHEVPDRVTRSLRLVVLGGEPIVIDDVCRWFARFGEASPRLVNMYGITETTVHVTHRTLTAAERERTEGTPIGRAMPHATVHVLDERGVPVTPGEVGEIYVGGHGVARGYWRQSQITAERFVPDPFTPSAGARLYRSGDAALLGEDGELWYRGRLDAQVKVRGHRIELGEIERTLRRRPGICQAVAAKRERPGAGEYLVAAVTCNSGEPASHDAAGLEATLLEYLRRELPAHMVPLQVRVVNALPIGPTGKVDRAAIPDAEPERLGHSPARSATERTVARIWQRALALDDVPIDQDFFDLGGHSLLLVDVQADLEEQLAVVVDLELLLRHRTVRTLSAAICEEPS